MFEFLKSKLKHSKLKYRERRFFDESAIPLDVWRVLRTASLLSVPEFRVFEIAYEQWFGNRADEKTIERYYVGYMFRDIVPMWVRHFCHRVIALDAEDALDPAAFGIKRRRATQAQKNQGYEYLVWIAASMIVLVILAELTARTLNLHCSFPPCY